LAQARKSYPGQKLFKIRGGFVYLDELTRIQPELPGVIAASTGNHGQSIAFAARKFGVRAVIVVPHGNNPRRTGRCNPSARN